MKLRLQKHATVIELEEKSPWLSDLTQTMKRSFKKTFWVNNILINLPVKGEEQTRRLFLLHLYKHCAKETNQHNSRFLKRLLESSHKPIKMIVLQITMPVKTTTVKILLTKSRLFFQFPKEETFLFWYLFHQFKPYEPQHRFFKKQFWMTEPPKELHKELITLFAKPQVFDYFILYKYDAHELHLFFEKRATLKEQVPDPMQMHYQTLDVKEDTHMEEVRRRYLKLAKRYHPDHAINNAEAQKHTRKFQKIQEAYHAIKAQKIDSA